MRTRTSRGARRSPRTARRTAASLPEPQKDTTGRPTLSTWLAPVVRLGFRLRQLRDRLVVLDQVHRPLHRPGNGRGLRVDAQVVVQRGYHVLVVDGAQVRVAAVRRGGADHLAGPH